MTRGGNAQRYGEALVQSGPLLARPVFAELAEREESEFPPARPRWLRCTIGIRIWSGPATPPLPGACCSAGLASTGALAAPWVPTPSAVTSSKGRAHAPAIIAALWITGFMKVLGALLALALVGHWGRRLPRTPLLLLGWGAAVVLTLYGGVLVAGEALVASGLIRPGAVDWKPLLWHLYVWDMSFLIWGILFGLAAWHYSSATSRPG